MNELAHNKKHVLKATMMIMFIAMVASFVVKPVAAAQDKDFRESPSFRTMNTAIIKGSEKVPEISIGQFLTNIWHTTGIYKIIHQPTDEEIAQAKAEEAAKNQQNDDAEQK